jgi:uncharacterized damage-inducible protein DinB
MSTTKKDAFLKRYARSRARLHAFVDGLSEAQRSGPKDAAGWTINDHLAHLSAWQLGIARLLLKQPRWAAMGISAAQRKESAGIDELNAILQRKHHSWSSKRVWAALVAADAEFVAALQPLRDDDIKRPYAWYSGEPEDARTKRPVMGWVDGDSAHHYDEHLPWMQAIVEADRAANIALYGAGCDLLDTALKKVPRAAWHFKPSKRDWSVHEVIIHLADSETNSYLRCRKALAEPGGAIMAYEQDDWATRLDYASRNADEALAVVRLVRKMTFDLIRVLPAKSWNTTYFHPESRRQVPLDEWLAGYADHIPDHIRQIEENVARFKKRAT